MKDEDGGFWKTYPTKYRKYFGWSVIWKENPKAGLS